MLLGESDVSMKLSKERNSYCKSIMIKINLSIHLCTLN